MKDHLHSLRVPPPPGHSGPVKVLLLAFLPFWIVIDLAVVPVAGTSPRIKTKPQSSQPGDAQAAASLRPGDHQKLRMAGGGTRSFKVSLSSGQYLRIVIQQQGIILTAQLRDPGGKHIIEMDNPCGGHGPVYVSTIADATGDYRLDLSSTEKWANEGGCEIVIEELREATSKDKSRVSAEKAFAEARSSFKQATKESRLAAMKKYQEALSYWKGIGDRHWTGLTLYSIAVTSRRLGELKEAEKYFDDSLKIPLDAPDWRLTASALNDRGLNYADLGEPEKAHTSLNEALRLFTEHRDPRGQASALNNIGLVHARNGQMRQAAEFYEKALPLRQAENDRTGQLIILNNIGGLHDALGEPYEALEYYRKALQVWQELEKAGQLNNRVQMASGYNNVAVAYDKLGEWQPALDHYERALKISEETGDRPGEAATLDNIGELYAVLGDPARAMVYFEKARHLIQETVKDPSLEANVLNHIGQVHLSRSNLTEALAAFQRSVTLKQGPRAKAEALTNIGLLNALQGNLQGALEMYDKALALHRETGNHRGEAIALHKRAEAYALLGKPAEALADFDVAITLWQSLSDRRGKAASLYGIARIKRDRNELEEALKRNHEVIDVIESLRTKVNNHQLRVSYFANQQNYYELYIDLMMRIYERDRSPHYLAEALLASERSRARNLIDTLVEAQADITQDVDKTLIKQLREVQQRLNAKAVAQMDVLNRKHSDQEAAAIAREIDDLIEDYDGLKAKIRVSSPKYARLHQPQPVSLKEIQKMLDDDTLLLEFALGDERSYLWLVSNTSIIASASLPKRAEIEDAARQLYEILTALQTRADETAAERQKRIAMASARYSSTATKLSRILLGPVAEQLGNKRLVIVGDGVLQYLPFNALPVPAMARLDRGAEKRIAAQIDTTRYLIEDHEIISLPSASAFFVMRSEQGRSKRAPLDVAVLADPVFYKEDPRFNITRDKRSASQAQVLPSASSARGLPDNLTLRSGLGLQPLPSTLKEAQAIKAAAPPGKALIALGFEASRATVQELQKGQYRIVHFATHGILNTEHPELSGIVLSLWDADGNPQNDGILRLHDIYNLKLPVELVVLSACSTGLGPIIKGEGLVGLTRGFMYAGSPRVIASLWRVDDLATSLLMGRLYQHILKDGMPPASALRQAQLGMVKGQRWRSPFYWAGFVLQGEWGESYSK